MNNISLKQFYCVSCGNNLENAIIQDGKLSCPVCGKQNGIVLIGAGGGGIHPATGTGGNGGFGSKYHSVPQN